MPQITLGPNRAYPALPTVGQDLESHSRALEAIIEAIQIHERRTGDTLDSFVRVGELATLGLVQIDGRIVSDNPTEESTTHHHDSTYLRLDGTNDPITGSVSFQSGVTIAGSLDVTSATFTGLESGDLADVASIGMLDEAESVLAAWTFTAGVGVTGAITFDNAIGTKATWYAGYLTGIEASTLYWKSNTYFRWYAGVAADDGVSDHMQLSSTALDVNVNANFSSGIDVTGNITVTGTVDGVDVAAHAADSTIHFTVASIDHGSIAGLSDDDHPQYPLQAGTESITGTWTLDGSVTESDFGTGGKVKDGTDVARPIGFNVAPLYNVTGSSAFDLAHVGFLYHKNSGAAFTLTCDNVATIPQGAMWFIHNDDTEDLTIAQGTGVTVYWVEGGNAPVAGNVTVKQGGIVTVYKFSDTEFWAWGSKELPSIVVTMNDLSDVTLTSPTTNHFLRHNGTNWVNGRLDTNHGVLDGSGVARDIGYNVVPVYEIDANDAFDDATVGYLWHKDANAAVTFTCDNVAGIPQGAMWFVHNDDTEDLTIAQGTGVTIYWLQGGNPPEAGNVTVKQGGMVTVYKYTNTEYWVWGTKEATSIVVTLDGLSDVTITAAASGDFLRHNGTIWVDSPIQNSDISAAMVTQHQASIDHDALTNFVANEHIDWTTASAAFSTTGTAATGALTVTGNIVVTGTVDGIDIAALDAAVAKTADNETITGTWTLDGAVTGSDFGTGGKVKDGTDVARPIGFNVAPVYEIDVNDSFDLAHNGMLWHKDANAAVTFTCDNDATIPQGAMWFVHNDDTEDLTIAQGTGVTIYWLTGGNPPEAGNVTVKQGGIVTVYKYSDTEFWCWGSKEASSVVVTLDGLSDVIITSAASGDFLRHNGTNWVDSTIQNSDISAAMVTQHQASIDHDALLNFVANEHINWTSTSSNFSTTGTLASGVATFSGNAQVANFKGGAADHVYIAWYADAAAQSTRSAYMGFGSAGSNDLYIANEQGSNIFLTGNVNVSSGLDVTGNITVTGTVDGVDIATRDGFLTTLDGAAAKTADSETITGTWTLDGPVTTADYGTGGRVKDGSDVARPIGFNVAPIFEQDANDSFDLAHVGYLWHKDLNAAVTYTCDNDANIPAGAMWFVFNDDTEDLTIAQGTGVTIYWLEAGAAPASGNVTIKQGGIVTVFKYTDTEFWCWGSKEAGVGVTTLAGLNDVVITAAASGDFLRHNGTNWVDSVIQNSDISAAMVTQHVGSINHDALLNFVANEHIDWTSATQNLSTSGQVAANRSSTSLLVTGVFANTNDAGGSEVQVRGNGQGDGYIFVGQSATYGGGIAYRGDGTSPKAMTGAGTDRVTYFRRNADVDEEVFSYAYSDNTVRFRGNVDANSGLDVTGSITVTGTVDGRDVATDGTKLDGIESGADVTDATNVAAAGAAMLNQTETITGTWTLDGSVTESDFGTGGKIKDGTDVARPIGFNVAPIYEIDANDTFDLAHVGMMWHKDLNAAVTFTCANDATIPVGAMWFVFNDDTEDLTIAQGTGVTIYWLEAGAAPASGNVTVKQGGIVTVFKYTDTEFWAWGSKEAGAGVTTLAGLNDVTITAVGANEILGHNGTNWLNRTLAEAGIAPTASPTFTGTVSMSTLNAGNIDSSGTITASSYHTVDAGNGNGYGFWGGAATTYGHFMSQAATQGRIAGETTSDYNQYFEMNSGTNRGFVFETGGTKLFAINPDAVRSAVNIYPAGQTAGYIGAVTGNYGSIQVAGADGSSGTWGGVSLQGEYVFMSYAGVGRCGIYNDVDNEWMVQWYRNAQAEIYYNGGVELQTASHNALSAASGAQVKDHGATMRYVGFNTLDTFNMNVSDTLEAQHCGKLTGKTNTTAYTLTGPDSTATANVDDFPVGGVCTVANLGTSVNYTISDTATCTMYYLDGSAAPVDIVGSGTLAPGGIVTLWRYSTTAIYIWGSGFTP